MTTLRLTTIQVTGQWIRPVAPEKTASVTIGAGGNRVNINALKTITFNVAPLCGETK